MDRPPGRPDGRMGGALCAEAVHSGSDQRRLLRPNKKIWLQRELLLSEGRGNSSSGVCFCQRASQYSLEHERPIVGSRYVK